MSRLAAKGLPAGVMVDGALAAASLGAALRGELPVKPSMLPMCPKPPTYMRRRSMRDGDAGSAAALAA